MLIERKNEKFLKEVVEEVADTYNKVKSFFNSKFEKNIKRVNEK